MRSILIPDVQPYYRELHRHYHNWHHIETLLKDFDHYAEHLGMEPRERLITEIAILYHDVIYDPKASDNEMRSAGLMRYHCVGLVHNEIIVEIEQWINATKGHLVDEETDANLALRMFLDADLMILAAQPFTFATYEDGIRKEYSHVPDADYRKGRSDFMEKFLQRPKIFNVYEAERDYGDIARANIRNLIEKLRS